MSRKGRSGFGAPVKIAKPLKAESQEVPQKSFSVNTRLAPQYLNADQVGIYHPNGATFTSSYDQTVEGRSGCAKFVWNGDGTAGWWQVQIYVSEPGYLDGSFDLDQIGQIQDWPVDTSVYSHFSLSVDYYMNVPTVTSDHDISQHRSGIERNRVSAGAITYTPASDIVYNQWATMRVTQAPIDALNADRHSKYAVFYFRPASALDQYNDPDCFIAISRFDVTFIP